MKLLQQQTEPCPDMVPRPSDDGVPLPLPSQMIAEAARHVVGQERAKQALAATLYRHYYPGKEDNHNSHTGSVLDTRMSEVIPNVLREVEQLAHEPLHPRPQFLLVLRQADRVD